MTLPIYFKLPQYIKDDAGKWLSENGLLGFSTYDWFTGIIGFESEVDAIAFSLKFGIQRFETTIERMLRIEESHN